MSNLDLAIAAQSATLDYRKQRLRQRKDALRSGALNFCRKPGTLAGAVATGATLGFLLPAGRVKQTIRPHASGLQAFLRQQFSSSLKLLMVNAIGRMFIPTQREAEADPNDLS